jgi:hypothetical protein
MEITKSSIEDLLDNLVKPMFDGIVEIEVDSLSLFDDPNLTALYPTISVIYDKEKYNKELELHWDGYNYELEDKITKEVKSTLKYFNIHNSIVDFYVISDI